MESQGEAIQVRPLGLNCLRHPHPVPDGLLSLFLSSMLPPSTYILSPIFISCIGSLFINRSFSVFEPNRFVLLPPGPWRPTSSLRP